MSFLPRQRPAPLVEDDEDGGGGNVDGSIQLDSLALLLATAYLLAYLTLHTITGWASIATVLPLTAALLYHWYRDDIPHSTAADIQREQAELSAMMKAAVVYCSSRKSGVVQGERSFLDVTVDELDVDEQKGRAEAELQSLLSPHLYLQLTSPNAHSHPIELADDSAGVRNDRRTTSEGEGEDEDEEEKNGEERAAGSSSNVEQQQRAASATSVTTPTRSTPTGGAAASLLSPKTPTAVLDVTDT